MTGGEIFSDDVIALSIAEARIHAPIDSIDLATWVFTLTDADYRACSPAHIAAAATRHGDGRRMSINVERVGNLLVQHYVEVIGERLHCRLVSETDSFGPSVDDRGDVAVVWEFTATAIDGSTTKFVNRTEAHAPPGYREALERRGVTFDQARAAATRAMGAHNAEETPLFARDIERKALAGTWKP